MGIGGGMTYITIPNEIADGLADRGEGQWLEGYEIVVNRHTGDEKRWTSIHELVIRAGDNLYRAFYEVGLTEDQDYRPFEWDGPMIKFEHVIPVAVEYLEYQKVA